jgi:ABC-type phosphate transport system substrate-binding protein
MLLAPSRISEIELCKQNGIEYVEIPAAFDGLSVVVNNENNFASLFKTRRIKNHVGNFNQKVKSTNGIKFVQIFPIKI